MDLMIRFIVAMMALATFAVVLSILVYWLSGGPKGRSDASMDSRMENAPAPPQDAQTAGSRTARVGRVSSSTPRVAQIRAFRRDQVSALERMKRHR